MEKNLTITLFLLLVSISTFYASKNLKTQRIYSQISNLQDMADFLNAIYGLNLGNEILLNCETNYYSDEKSHVNFVNKYNAFALDIKRLLAHKRIPEITGETCFNYEENPNEFNSAKEKELNVEFYKNTFVDFLNSSFAKSFTNFSRCIGEKKLIELSGKQELVQEVNFLFTRPSDAAQLFESVCSINNIFSQIKKVNLESNDTFTRIGNALRAVSKLVRPHYLTLN